MHHSDFIQTIAKVYNPELYLELGLYHGETINKVSSMGIKCIGVDVSPIQQKQNQVIYNCSTDEFFQKNLPIHPDMVFIDADHKYESAKRDFENVLNIIADNGVIILHDTDPMSEKYVGAGGCGDVYRLIDDLEKQDRFNLVTLPVAEAGLTVVTFRGKTRTQLRHI